MPRSVSFSFPTEHQLSYEHLQLCPSTNELFKYIGKIGLTTSPQKHRIWNWDELDKSHKRSRFQNWISGHFYVSGGFIQICQPPTWKSTSTQPRCWEVPQWPNQSWCQHICGGDFFLPIFSSAPAGWLSKVTLPEGTRHSLLASTTSVQTGSSVSSLRSHRSMKSRNTTWDVEKLKAFKYWTQFSLSSFQNLAWKKHRNHKQTVRNAYLVTFHLDKFFWSKKGSPPNFNLAPLKRPFLDRRTKRFRGNNHKTASPWLPWSDKTELHILKIIFEVSNWTGHHLWF